MVKSVWQHCSTRDMGPVREHSPDAGAFNSSNNDTPFRGGEALGGGASLRLLITLSQSPNC